MPDLMAPFAGPLPEHARRLCERAHGRGHPYHWAGFAYLWA